MRGKGEAAAISHVTTAIAIVRDEGKTSSTRPPFYNKGAHMSTTTLPNLHEDLSSGAAKDQEIWPRALRELKLQLPKATFDTWLMGTDAELEGDTLQILVGTPFAEEWLEHRLRDKIEAAVAASAGRPLDVVFAIRAASRGSPTPTLPEPGPGEIAVELVEFDPTKRGFVMTANYAIRFWQPYLGLRPFALWQTLKSFAFEAGQDTWPSIQTLADIVANGNRYAITGRAACNGRKRQVGALEVLEEERIVWVLREGEGGGTRYRFRVLNSFPLLTPAQVKRLPPNLRAAHERFISLTSIDYQEWRQMTLPTLAGVSGE